MVAVGGGEGVASMLNAGNWPAARGVCFEMYKGTCSDCLCQRQLAAIIEEERRQGNWQGNRQGDRQEEGQGNRQADRQSH